jgi:hypothetical protein
MTDGLEDTTRVQNVICSCLFAKEPQESVAFAFLLHEYLKGKNRKWRDHPLNAVRHHKGHFYTLCTPLREVPATCLHYFRMKARTFDELLSCGQNHLKKSDTNVRAATGTKEMRTITISTTPEENLVIQVRECQIPQVTDVNYAPVWLAPFQDTQSCNVRLEVRVHTKSTYVATSVNKCACASYVGIHWLLYISTSDAFCGLVWPQPNFSPYPCQWSTQWNWSFRSIRMLHVSAQMAITMCTTCKENCCPLVTLLHLPF